MSAELVPITELYQRGRASLARRDFSAAKAYFADLLKQDPDHADALHGLAAADAAEGRFASAERLLRRAVAVNPMQVAYQVSLADALLADGRIQEAERLCAHAVAMEPSFAPAHVSLGAVLIQQRRLDEAVEALLKAVDLEPGFAEAYNHLGRAYNNRRDLRKAADAFRRAVLLRPDYTVAYNNLGHALRALGELDEARSVFEHVLALDANYHPARRNLATILAAQGDLEGAVLRLEECLETAPRDRAAVEQLGVVQHTLGRLQAAARTYRRALALSPADPELLLKLGLVLNEARQTADAEAAFLEARGRAPADPRIHAELAALYEETNRLDRMEESVGAGLAVAPEDPRLNLEAATLDRRLDRAQQGLQRLARFELARLDERLREQFRFELGNLADRAGDPPLAWEHFTAANALAATSPRARNAAPARYFERVRRIERFFASAEPAGWAPPPDPGRAAPAFMFGFPRSGTTLLDVVLDAHPRVRTLEEQPTISELGTALAARGYPDCMAQLSAADLGELQQLFFATLDELAPDVTNELVIDKMPLRTIHTGMLWRILPQARFVFCVRHPCDVVLSNFMQHYTPSDAFAHFWTITDAARLYDAVMSLWRVLTQKLPLHVHLVKYEELVADVEGQARRLLGFLDVEWDDAVLDHVGHVRRQRARINTTSYHQVAEPVYTRAVDRWRRYRAQLEPVLPLLAPHAVAFGYEL